MNKDLLENNTSCSDVFIRFVILEYQGVGGNVERIKIKVKFHGYIAKKIDDKEIEIETSNDLQKCIVKINEVINQRIGSDISYTVLLNGVNYSMVKNKEFALKQGDVFNIVPIIVGG